MSDFDFLVIDGVAAGLSLDAAEHEAYMATLGYDPRNVGGDNNA